MQSSAAQYVAARGLGRAVPLRACDLVPGRNYISPSGRKVRLLPSADYGIGTSCYAFAYLTPWGKPGKEGFYLNANNAAAIGALKECF